MELISKYDVIKALQKWNCRDYISLTINPYEVLRNIPTVEERKEGEWIDAGMDGEKCSRCGWSIDDTYYSSQFLYCPNCGARMKGD